MNIANTKLLFCILLRDILTISSDKFLSKRISIPTQQK
jgi:hypothetical protein